MSDSTCASPWKPSYASAGRCTPLCPQKPIAISWCGWSACCNRSEVLHPLVHWRPRGASFLWADVQHWPGLQTHGMPHRTLRTHRTAGGQTPLQETLRQNRAQLIGWRSNHRDLRLQNKIESRGTPDLLPASSSSSCRTLLRLLLTVDSCIARQLFTAHFEPLSPKTSRTRTSSRNAGGVLALGNGCVGCWNRSLAGCEGSDAKELVGPLSRQQQSTRGLSCLRGRETRENLTEAYPYPMTGKGMMRKLHRL